MTAVRDLHEKWMQDTNHRESYHEETKGSGLNCQLHLGDCLDVMKGIPEGSIDAIITDLPYGVTACKWDSIIPFEPMWDCVKRLIKPRGAVVLFGSQPFTSALVMSNPKWFKHEWVWVKERGVGFQIAKYRPMMQTENISVFSTGSVNYYPQMTPLKNAKIEKFASSKSDSSPIANVNSGYRLVTHRYPKNVLEFRRERGLHPTQKPVDLLAYLIRTYTMPGETVLDFTMGSGSTGVAALQEGRNFIGIEKDEGYFKIAQERLAKTQSPAQLQLV